VRDIYFSEKNFIKEIKAFFKLENISIEKMSKSIWLNKSDIKKLVEKGHTLGLHSHHHPSILRGLNYQTQEKE
jgi:hypothetical protein